MKKTKRQASQQKPKGANVNDVVIRALDVFYDLANNGQLFALIFLVFACILIIVAFRMPTENLDIYIKQVFLFFQSAQYPVTLLSVCLLFSITINIQQARIYKLEINRLVEQRQDLVHGKNSGTLNVLETHSTSDFQLSEEG